MKQPFGGEALRAVGVEIGAERVGDETSHADLRGAAEEEPDDSEVVEESDLRAGLLHLCADLGNADVERGVPGNGTAIVLERRDGVWSCLSWPSVVHH